MAHCVSSPRTGERDKSPTACACSHSVLSPKWSQGYLLALSFTPYQNCRKLPSISTWTPGALLAVPSDLRLKTFHLECVCLLTGALCVSPCANWLPFLLAEAFTVAFLSWGMVFWVTGPSSQPSHQLNLTRDRMAPGSGSSGADQVP